MTEAEVAWVSWGEAVARVARHLGCTPEDAKLRIVGKAKAAWVRACGVTSEAIGVAASPLCGAG